MIGKAMGSAVLALALAFGGAAQAAPRAPQDVVNAVYASPGAVIGPNVLRSTYAADLDAALRILPPPADGQSSFDYRYGSTNAQVSGLQLLEEIDNDQAHVVAVFKRDGRPNSVNWTLCRASGGDWRISDAWSNTGSETWDLRGMLSLNGSSVRC